MKQHLINLRINLYISDLHFIKLQNVNLIMFMNTNIIWMLADLTSSFPPNTSQAMSTGHSFPSSPQLGLCIDRQLPGPLQKTCRIWFYFHNASII